MSLSLAFIPLNPGAKLSADAIAADYAEKWPRLPRPRPRPAKGDHIAFRIGDSDAIIGPMPAPIPWSDLEGPCKTSWLWPEAESALRGHDRHLIVTVMSEKGPVEQSTVLTQVCASILATCAEAPGVFWSNATLLVPSKVFQEFATQILPGAPPLYIWVNFHIGRAGKGRTRGFTTGMAALGQMEFETESSPEPPPELRDRLFGLCNYVLEHGPVIKDGDTIGEDENERIQVVYSASAFGQKGKVMRLEYEAAESEGKSGLKKRRKKKKGRMRMTAYGYIHAAATILLTIGLAVLLHWLLSGVLGPLWRHLILDLPVLLTGVVFLVISDRILQATIGLEAFDEVPTDEAD